MEDFEPVASFSACGLTDSATESGDCARIMIVFADEHSSSLRRHFAAPSAASQVSMPFHGGSIVGSQGDGRCFGDPGAQIRGCWRCFAEDPVEGSLDRAAGAPAELQPETVLIENAVKEGVLGPGAWNKLSVKPSRGARLSQ